MPELLKMASVVLSGRVSVCVSTRPVPGCPGEQNQRKLYVCLGEHEEEMGQYVNAIGVRMNDAQGMVSRFWTIVWPMLTAPPGVCSACCLRCRLRRGLRRIPVRFRNAVLDVHRGLRKGEARWSHRRGNSKIWKTHSLAPCLRRRSAMSV